MTQSGRASAEALPEWRYNTRQNRRATDADENDYYTEVDRSRCEGLGRDCKDWPIGRLVSDHLKLRS
jgi:hypothetical protein